MRLPALLLLAAMFVSFTLAAATPTSQAVHQVIAAQIDAFRHDDAERAFSFASPALRRQFGNAAHFLAIVQHGYPAVYRPRSYSFSAFSADGAQAMQKVEVIGPDGAPVLALYTLEREADGAWRITGCQLLKSELQAA